jgi:hypothetical protein
MRAKEFIIEAKGLFGRKLGDVFVNDQGDKIKFQGAEMFPSINPGDQYPDLAAMRQALHQVSKGYDLQPVNGLKNSALAFAIATLTWEDGGEEVWIKFFNKVPNSLIGSWPNKETPEGWKLETKTAVKARSGLTPQDLIKTDRPFSSVSDIIAAVQKNGASPEIIQGLTMAAEGKMPVFTGMASQLPAVRDMLGEIIQPIAIVGGLVKGDIEKARTNILNTAWDQCVISFPQSRIAGLTDSEFKDPNTGISIGISTKGDKGASASVGNIYAAIQKARDNQALLDSYPYTVNVITKLATASAKEGPILLSEELSIITPELANEIRKYLRGNTTDTASLSPDAKAMFSAFGSKESSPGYSVGLVLLTNIAKTLANSINRNQEFTKGCLAFLNQSSIVQIHSTVIAKGEDVLFTDFYSVYPPNFTGHVKADANKSYTSTQIKGRIGFSFQ